MTRLRLARTTETRPTVGGPTDPMGKPAAGTLGGTSSGHSFRTRERSRPLGQGGPQSHTPQGSHPMRARGTMAADDPAPVGSSDPFNVRDDHSGVHHPVPVEHSPENGPFDARRDKAAGAFPSSLGAGGPPNLDDQSHGADRWLIIIAGGGACWAAFIGVLVGVWTVDVLFAALAMYTIGIALVAAAGIADRTSIDILGDRQAKHQERLACHLLHEPTGNVQASPISRPIPKCAKCREPVFLSGLCAAHFQQYIDLATTTRGNRATTSSP